MSQGLHTLAKLHKPHHFIGASSVLAVGIMLYSSMLGQFARAATAPTGSIATSYTLSVTKAGLGTGTITSNLGGINCGTACSTSLASGANPILFALHDPTVTVAWKGDCTVGESPDTCYAIMNGTKNVTATFSPVATSYTLSVTKTGNGTGTVTSLANPPVTSGGINCGAVCTTSYLSGTAVTLTATAGTGSTFAGWTGDCVGSTVTCTVSLSSSKTVTATFVAPLLPTVVTDDPGVATSASAVLNGHLVSTGGLGGSVYFAIAQPGATDITCNGTNFDFAPPAQSFTAADGARAYSMVATKQAATALKPGTTYRYCMVATTSNGTTFGNIKSFTTALAGSTATLTVTKTGAGSGTVFEGAQLLPGSVINCGTVCSASFLPGVSFTLTAAPVAGSVFTGWSGGCTGTSPSCVLTMTSDQQVTANFTTTTTKPTLTVVVVGSGEVDDSSNNFIRCGNGNTRCTTSAIPSGTQFFLHGSNLNAPQPTWTGCTTVVPSGQCLQTMGTSDMTVTATFGSATPNVTASLDSTTPPAGSVSPGQSGVRFLSFDLSNNSGQSILLEGIRVTSDTINPSAVFSNIKAFDGSNQIGQTATFTWNSEDGYYAWIWLTPPYLSVPTGSSKLFTIRADVSATATGTLRLGINKLTIEPGQGIGGLVVWGNTMTVPSVTPSQIKLITPPAPLPPQSQPTLSDITADAQAVLNGTAASTSPVTTIDQAQLQQRAQEIISKITALQAELATITPQLKDFIALGTPTTQGLGLGERAGVVSSFTSAFGKAPTTETDFEDVIKIANGRWPTQRSADREAAATSTFEKVYQRLPDTTNVHDNAAVTVMAYGLRPANRNLTSEAAAIRSFKAIYGTLPTTSSDWDVVRGIAYSGATR